MLPAKTFFLQKIGLIAFGVFLSLVAVEAGLRAGGLFFGAVQELRNLRSAGKKGAYRIMCIGESTTACGGEDAYPAQLERILNSAGTGIKFSVINKGIPSKNTTDILNSLESDIDRFAPDMVIAMMGINDEWLLVEEAAAVKKPWFSRVRLYKLMKRLLPRGIYKTVEISGGDTAGEDGIEEGAGADVYLQDDSGEGFRRKPEAERHMRAGTKFYNEGEYRRAAKEFREAIGIDEYDRRAYDMLGSSLIFDGKDNEALEVYRNFTEVSPNNVQLHYEMGKVHLYRGEYDKAEAAFLRAVQLSKAQQYSEFNRENEGVYGALSFLGELRGDEEFKLKYSYLLDALKEKYRNTTTRANYLAVRDTSREKGIKLIAVQYAMRNSGHLRDMLGVSEDVIFVDNERLFKDVVKESGYRKYFSDMWAGDFGHCTRKGNRLLAGNIAKAVLREALKK